MTQKLIIIAFICLLSAELYFCAHIARQPRSAESEETVVTESPVENPAEHRFISSATREQFEREALNETKIFLNTLFRSQIVYFSKVKEFLPATVKRVADINKYIERLEKAILADSVQEKDKMWRDTFVEAPKICIFVSVSLFHNFLLFSSAKVLFYSILRRILVFQICVIWKSLMMPVWKRPQRNS
uniref:Uncharacterized protein n=1 Tax=Bactrocera latifrons TaxID=174628 RepID=A0A0K8VZD7_BACLA